MKWRDVARKLLSSWPWLLALALIAAVVWSHFFVQRWTKVETPKEKPRRDRYVPVEQRYEGLDKTIAGKVRIPGDSGVENIAFGSVESRKMKFGGFRIGTFNEAVIKDVILTVNESFFSASSGDRTADPAPERTKARASDPRKPNSPDALRPHSTGSGAVVRDHERAQSGAADPAGAENSLDSLRQLLADMRKLLSLDGKKFSSMRIQGFSLILRQNATSETCIVRCARLVPSNGESGNCMKGSDVVFQTVLGEQLSCPEVLFRLGKQSSIMATVNHAVLRTSGGTNAIRQFSFPLSAMTDDQGLARLARDQHGGKGKNSRSKPK